MKIFILKVPKELQPDSSPIIYPQHNADYGVEQDFLKYLSLHPDRVTIDQTKADWHYLPVYWTRWHLSHNYAQNGIKELQEIVDKVIIVPSKTFTVCQYDDGPVIKTNGVRLMLASRMKDQGIDIPLISKQHKVPWFGIKKKNLATFVGRISTHPVRRKMAQYLSGDESFKIIDGDLGTKEYVKHMVESYAALCPRGYGGSSFRFFEAMQMGIVPILIGDIDIRPFKDIIPWHMCSMYTDNVGEISTILSTHNKDELVKMGKYAKIIWQTHLNYQKWCNLALKELK